MPVLILTTDFHSVLRVISSSVVTFSEGRY